MILIPNKSVPRIQSYKRPLQGSAQVCTESLFFCLSQLALSLHHLHGDNHVPHNWLVEFCKYVRNLDKLFG